MRLFDSRLEVTEETFCKIMSDCRGECDLEANENEENLESSLDSEEEEADFTALTNIWSRRRSVRPPRRIEDVSSLFTVAKYGSFLHILQPVHCPVI